MKVSCLGPEGSYSCLAARQFNGGGEIIPCRTFARAMACLLSGEADAAALPIENTIQGGVLQNLDLLQKTEGVYAVKEYVLKLDHRLALREGATIGEVKTVYSHAQALSQCGEYLSKYLPQAELKEVSSTAESLSLLTDNSCAGIVGAHVKKQGVVISDRNIADEQNNFTHFLLVQRGESAIAAHTAKVFYSAVGGNRPGTLMKLLQLMYVYDLNMTKIESRPIKSSPGEYRFFIEFEGDYADWKVQKAVADIRAECRSFKLLGAY